MADHQTTQVDSAARQGLYVAAVSYNKDFQVGDRIVGVNGVPVATGDQIRDVLNDCRVGDVVSVDVMRDGQPVEVYVPFTETAPPAA